MNTSTLDRSFSQNQLPSRSITNYLSLLLKDFKDYIMFRRHKVVYLKLFTLLLIILVRQNLPLRNIQKPTKELHHLVCKKVYKS